MLKLKLGWPIGSMGLCAFLGACGGSSQSPTTNANAGSTNTGGTIGAAGTPTGGAGGASAAGTAGTTGGGAANGGTAGTTAGTGGTQGGGGGTTGGAAGTTGGTAGNAGAAGAAGNGACAAPHLICDDFEKYPAASDLSPDWIAYEVSGTVNVDTTKPHAGAQSLHLTVEAGLRHYASLIRFTSGEEVVPLHHFGRMMVWLTQVPMGDQHWNLNMASGPFTGMPDEEVKYLQGGMFGKLMSNYAQRARPKMGDEYLLRGGGPQQGDLPADSDCAVAAPTQTIAAGQWVCWEWEFDAPNATARLWLDEQPMTEIDAIGHGTQCQGPGFNGVPMSTDYPWDAPEMFDKIFIGWEQYQDMPAQEMWVDDLVISTERVLCPQ